MVFFQDARFFPCAVPADETLPAVQRMKNIDDETLRGIIVEFRP
jgi:hypothetical protein